METLLPSYEIWNWIKGYEGRYEVSNRARLRYWVHISGNKKGVSKKFFTTPKYKKLFPTKWGYWSSAIGSEKLGNYKAIRIHREVAFLFVPNPENKPEVNHLNGDKDCNEWWNFEWATRLENIGHAFSTGLIIPAVGEQQSNTKLKNGEVLEIFNSSLSTKELSKKYNIGHDGILDIKRGRTWNHLTGKVRNPKIEKLTMEFILSVFNFHGTAKEASVYFKRSYSLCNNIKSGIKYSDITGKNFERRNKVSINPTEEIILSIYRSSKPTKDLAVEFNCSESFVKNIKTGKRYTEITKHN